MDTNRTILIAGAGIGGLTLGVALRRAGFSVRVFERAATLRPIGAGITMQANAMLAFRTIGVDAAVAAAGHVMQRGSIQDQQGRTLGTMLVGEMAEELGAPMIAIHRARLQETLQEALGSESLTLGVKVVSFRDEPGGLFVRLSDGSEVQGDLLVGADGLRSVVRAQLLNDGEPRYAGYTSWRGVCEVPGIADPSATSESWGRGARFGIVPIDGGRTYWFATANAPQGGIDAPDSRTELLSRFSDWHAPIRALIENTQAAAIVRTDILDRPPVPHWSRGRVVLLGDAAHPMTPNMGQGGGQAVEDAVVLARCLAREAELPTALSRYEALRVPRANDFVVRSRRLGGVAQWENAAARWVRNRIFALTPPSSIRSTMRRALTFTPGP
ncbi:FAD-dependent monooxygenase [Hyalangium rubrum]|uniref:FAD-dependent monooxygenase n=1 Tax=Hyalangium rubrum TaxID=3103134 RepID=A0ABU5HDZ0_9BACT|nr:FAD-dependent monooxygenase [Hyalangium sp. s54d21]MDY7231696.1 FAD-dependent monooxygenase [Hyalangium sp. s54d21]